MGHLWELTTHCRSTSDGPAVVALLRMLSCFAPFTAQECLAQLGLTADRWPDVPVIAADTATCVVQIDGKVRDRLVVSVDVTEADLESLASRRQRSATLCPAPP